MTETTNNPGESPKLKGPEEPQEPKERGTAWMDFYVNWRFPLGFIFGGLAILGYIGDLIYGSYNILAVICVFLLDIPFYIFGFFVYRAMRKRTKDGYEMNVTYLVLEVLLYSVSYGIRNWSVGYAALGFVIAALAWTWPNYVYFKHREYLFGITAPGENPPENSPKQSEEKSPAPIAAVLYCKNCGAKLLPDSVFCSRCGAKVH